VLDDNGLGREEAGLIISPDPLHALFGACAVDRDVAVDRVVVFRHDKLLLEYHRK